MAQSSLEEQINELADRRGWFQPDDESTSYSAIRAYIQQTLTLSEAINAIVEPINHAYTTADGGKAIHNGELTAANQRQFHDPAKAEDMWGLPLSENDLPPLDEEQPSTESMLWDLWYSVLHTAKIIPWEDAHRQDQLINLVIALSQQPDPTPPLLMTKALRNNWIWNSGNLWSSLLMFGPSARETWNDSPGFGAGFEPAEIHAWTNVNAFIARVTRNGVRDFWIYAIWALRDGLEEKPEAQHGQHHKATPSVELDAKVPAAAVWVLILGKALYSRTEDLSPSDPRWGNPGGGGELWKERGGKAEFSKTRWEFWKTRFALFSKEKSLLQATRDIAGRAYNEMQEIEDSVSE